MGRLILPGDPLFYETLHQPPPNWRETAAIAGGDGCAFVVRAGSELMEPVTGDQLEDYLEGGEYDDRLIETGDNLVIF